MNVLIGCHRGLSCLITGLYSIKLNFAAVQLTKQIKGGVGGRLGYFVWEEYLFQA